MRSGMLSTWIMFAVLLIGIAWGDAHPPKTPIRIQGIYEQKFQEVGRVIDNIDDLNAAYMNLCAEQRVMLKEILEKDTMAQQIAQAHSAQLAADEQKLNDLYAQKQKLEGRKP